MNGLPTTGQGNIIVMLAAFVIFLGVASVIYNRYKK